MSIIVANKREKRRKISVSQKPVREQHVIIPP